MAVLSISFAKTHPGRTVPIFNTLVSTAKNINDNDYPQSSATDAESVTA